MIVVADASPLVGLVRIGEAEVLSKLYGVVVIPSEVAQELAGSRRPPEVRAFIASPPAWLTVKAPQTIVPITGLDSGELAAISLAKELNADLLLIDENKGREAAMALHIRTARTAAVLFDAANAGAIPNLKNVFDKLNATNFRVPPAVLDELLKRHEEIRRRRTDG